MQNNPVEFLHLQSTINTRASARGRIFRRGFKGTFLPMKTWKKYDGIDMKMFAFDDVVNNAAKPDGFANRQADILNS